MGACRQEDQRSWPLTDWEGWSTEMEYVVIDKDKARQRQTSALSCLGYLVPARRDSRVE
jgi:hypothetical protein